jgi:2-amino-4-hydroxy-6-hydroxymethyldihydropteridine diphosphokinase
MAETVYISLGSNMGDREKNLTAALVSLEAIPGLEIIATSGIYISEAQDMDEGSPDFMNQVVMADFSFLPAELLDGLERIETKMGRTDKGQHKPRVIDLDILLFGDRIIETRRLSIPHRQMLSRPFVLVPLLQINPELVHPVLEEPIADYLTDKDREKAILFKDHVARSI